jgi:NADH dehydrogenase [ubiquinone] 1 alpha subcomplex assembly factor 1
MINIDTGVLFDFSDMRASAAWFMVDDGVMGGISRGMFRHHPDGFARFSGTVRLENNGGFSSVQVRFRPADFRAYSGIHLRARGDGKRYALFIQTQPGPLMYQASFATTGGGWEDILLPFGQFRPEWYGQPVQAPGPDLSRIAIMSLIVPDKQPGPFLLDIARIGVYASV